jgi:tRNA1(Val) A37 N6-methylase TrmN6
MRSALFAVGASSVLVLARHRQHRRNSEECDVPGYGRDVDDGPECWKCKGQKVIKKSKKKKGSQCKICDGRGRLPGKTLHAEEEGVILPRAVTPKGWEEGCPIGPKPRGHNGQAELYPQKGEVLCFLVGDWRIFQRVAGHRYTTEDVITAWCAINAIESRSLNIKTHLDLGCGIGSVLMMVAWRFIHLQSTGVEAQQRSAEMARRSIFYNGAANRVKVFNGDLREHSGTQQFDLITGTPPYFQVQYRSDGSATTDTGAFSSCRQSAAARYEFRGGIEGYCEAAARFLSPCGIFVVCLGGLTQHDGKPHARATLAAEAAGLEVLEVFPVVGKAGKPPLFAVYTMARKTQQRTTAPAAKMIDPLVVRMEGGTLNPRYREIMRCMGKPY